MATVTIRNLDKDVVGRLKEKAKQNHRSLEAELRVILADEARRLTGKEEGNVVVCLWLFRAEADGPDALAPQWYVHGVFA